MQDPYLIAHNALIAHATAVKTYRTKYLPTQKGTIGESPLFQLSFRTLRPC